MHPTEIVQSAGEGDLPKVKIIAAKFPTQIDINYKGQTALTAAVGNENISIIKYLHTQGANINDQDSNGNTPMHIAVIEDKPKSIKCLQKMRAKLEKNNQGFTPLSLAKHLNHTECISALSEVKKKKDLKKELDRPRTITCLKCELEIAVINLMPCGHVVTCLDCAFKMDKCEFCGLDIDERVLRNDKESKDVLSKMIKKKKDSEEEMMCKICSERKIGWVAVNCGHLYCYECRPDKVVQDAKDIECSFCKQKIESCIQIYFP